MRAYIEDNKEGVLSKSWVLLVGADSVGMLIAPGTVSITGTLEEEERHDGLRFRRFIVVGGGVNIDEERAGASGEGDVDSDGTGVILLICWLCDFLMFDFAKDKDNAGVDAGACGMLMRRRRGNRVGGRL